MQASSVLDDLRSLRTCSVCPGVGACAPTHGPASLPNRWTAPAPTLRAAGPATAGGGSAAFSGSFAPSERVRPFLSVLQWDAAHPTYPEGSRPNGRAMPASPLWSAVPPAVGGRRGTPSRYFAAPWTGFARPLLSCSGRLRPSQMGLLSRKPGRLPTPSLVDSPAAH